MNSLMDVKQYFSRETSLDKHQLSKIVLYSKPFSHILPDIHDQISYVMHLNKEDQLVLKNYTGDLSLEVNQELRQNHLSDSSTSAVEVIDAIFKDCPLTLKPIIIYRGLTDVKPIDFLANDLGFVSCTINREKAFNYAKTMSGSYDTESGCLLHLTIPVGSKILPLFMISESVCEMEILLDRKTSIIIDKIDDYIIYCHL